MKIDIHTHTRKCKSGDPPTRDVSSRSFCEAVEATDVKIIAVTNHNLFDLAQYLEIVESIADDVQVWPGVELDIAQAEGPGHLLVIVSPELCNDLDEALEGLLGGSKPDDFSATIEEVWRAVDHLGPLYVAHHGRKLPEISAQTLDWLETNTNNPTRVMKEVSNAISAGIYIAHGSPSIYGSDIQDWADYSTAAQGLPELRLEVDSFERFCLLLERDEATIQTLLDKKSPENVALAPFDDAAFTLPLFNDINVVFGPKGTGKSCILAAIAEHYADRGLDAEVFQSSDTLLEETLDLAAKELSVDLASLGISDCAQALKDLRTAAESSVTSLADYHQHFRSQSSNRNAKKMRLRDMKSEPESALRGDFGETSRARATTSEFVEFFEEDPAIAKLLSPDERAEALRILELVAKRLGDGAWNDFAAWKAAALLNWTIGTIRSEIAKKTGTAAMPAGTGFVSYANNRLDIASNAQAIMDALATKIPEERKRIGNLGPEKGELELRTSIRFQDGSVTDKDYSPASTARKRPQKSVAKAVRDIRAHAFSGDLFKRIRKLNDVEYADEVQSVSDLLLVHRYLALDGGKYHPSSGESSMVLLQQELRTNRDIYILDEPERSLGNEYINAVIVPILRELAAAGKRIVISTHDANIAVRTLPYCSVYRRHDADGYHTYVGNPFSNDLVCLDDPNDRRDWRESSMTTLEGGAAAFGQRRRIYGQD